MTECDSDDNYFKCAATNNGGGMPTCLPNAAKCDSYRHCEDNQDVSMVICGMKKHCHRNLKSRK